MTLAVTADIYTQDRLVNGSVGATTAGAVKLGPTLGADLRWRLPTSRFRDLTLFASERYRSSFERDGVSVAGTSGSYFDGGIRGALPLTPATAITGALEGWVHSGLPVDNTLVTAAATGQSWVDSRGRSVSRSRRGACAGSLVGRRWCWLPCPRSARLLNSRAPCQSALSFGRWTSSSP